MKDYTTIITQIYVIDDDVYKRGDLANTVHTIFPDAKVETIPYAHTFLKYVRNTVDIIRSINVSGMIILDMQMPRYAGGEIIRKCGFEMLQHLQHYGVSCPIILVSSEKVDDVEANNLYSSYAGSITYSMRVRQDSAIKELLDSYFENR